MSAPLGMLVGTDTMWLCREAAEAEFLERDRLAGLLYFLSKCRNGFQNWKRHYDLFADLISRFLEVSVTEL